MLDMDESLGISEELGSYLSDEQAQLILGSVELWGFGDRCSLSGSFACRRTRSPCVYQCSGCSGHGSLGLSQPTIKGNYGGSIML